MALRLVAIAESKAVVARSLVSDVKAPYDSYAGIAAITCSAGVAGIGIGQAGRIVYYSMFMVKQPWVPQLSLLPHRIGKSHGSAKHPRGLPA